ncbi:MAG: SIS domain-containing protein [Chlamydiia bacterium]|nr:SIS domain-containing protein [Chlamydiia bacterium]
MRDVILRSVQKGIDAITTLSSEEGLKFIESVTWAIIDCYKNGGKLLIAGNGGSLCDAMHFAEELTGYFRKERQALPAIALADPGHITCVGNDAGFEEIFARGVEALGNPGDLFIALTTSGNSKNLLRAAQVAKQKQMMTIAFLGKTGGLLKGRCDYEWIVSGFEYSDRIQEAHMAAIHIMIEMVERELFFPVEEIETTGVL